jgi:hypothetical protein
MSLAIYDIVPQKEQSESSINLADKGVLTAPFRVVSFQYVPDLEAVCLATGNGDIVVIKTATMEAEVAGMVRICSFASSIALKCPMAGRSLVGSQLPSGVLIAKFLH